LALPNPSVAHFDGSRQLKKDRGQFDGNKKQQNICKHDITSSHGCFDNSMAEIISKKNAKFNISLNIR